MKKLYVFGAVTDSWKSWFYYGTVEACKKWLYKEGVEEIELDEWMKKARVFVEENKETLQ